MSRDFQQEAFREAVVEDERRQMYKTWIASRIETIHRAVTAHDVLRRNGVKLRYGDRVEQISCPFHGRDNKPSARVYPESSKGPSGVWCFVCQERWDAIGLWRKFGDFTGKFTALLRDIEQAHGIVPPESPREHFAEYEQPEDYALDEVKHLLSICDRRLTLARKAFDLEGFMRVSVALDRLRHQVDHKTLPLPKANEVLHTILAKISERVQQCHED